MGRSSVHSVALLAALVTAALVLLPSAALAQVSPADASATRAYLQAEHAQARAELNGFSTAIVAVEDLAVQVRSECPGVLAAAPTPAQGMPLSASVAALGEEQLDAVLGAAANTESARRRSFATLVARLRWSSAGLTRLVHEQADGEAERAAIPPPSLCADMRAWVAGGYQAIPAATSSYLRVESAVSAKTEGKEAAIKRKLVPYESPADKLLARKLARLEKSQLPALLKKLVAATAKVTEALVTAAPVPES